MRVNIYRTSDDANVVEKTMTYINHFDGTLREPCSILKPVIVFEYNTVPSNWTHMYIQSFDRWYFITDVVSVGKGLIQVSGRVDVLQSYKGSRAEQTGLYALPAIIARNETATDQTLTDNALPIQNNTTLTKITGTKTDNGNTWTSSEMIMKSTYQGDDGGKRYCQMLGLTPYDANSARISTGQPQAFYCLDQSDYLTLVQEQLERGAWYEGKAFTEYILSNFWLPYQQTLTGDTIAKLKTPGAQFNFDYTGISAKIIARGLHSCAWKVTIPCATYKYMNFAPYRDVYVQFFPFGRLKLDNSVIFSGALNSVDVYFKTVTNSLTGDSILYYGLTEAGATNFLSQSNVKVDLLISSNLTNYGQIAAGVASTVAAVAGGLSTGGIAGAAAVVGGTVGGMSTTVNASRSSSAGGLSGKYIDGAPTVIVYDNTIDANARNSALLGMPLYQNKYLYQVYGYTEISKIHLDGITATAGEKEELAAILSGGVIFEDSP